MRPRIEAELALLCEAFGDVEHVESGGEDWFRLPVYTAPEGWLIDGAPAGDIPVAFLIKADYPGKEPYGFLTPAGLTFRGKAPQKTGKPPKAVPFPGTWLHFSWQVTDWNATNDVRQGSNLLAWCRSFGERLRQGA